jgi:futalosine hydrolase
LNLNQDKDTIFNTNIRPEGRRTRILVATAVPAERDAIMRGLGDTTMFDVLAVGVGPVMAAVSVTKALAGEEYGLVMSAGIGGGFVGRAAVGSLVVASDIVAADLGADTPEGFLSLEELGFGISRISLDADLVSKVLKVLHGAKLPVTTGPVLTVSTVTGTEAKAIELASRVPGATAEAMEGFGVGMAARDKGIPFLEIRAISNPVGPRDRESWRIKEALSVLETASKILMGVL